MATARDRLRQKPRTATATTKAAAAQKPQPVEVKVAAPSVTMDTRAFADALAGLGQSMQALAQQQAAILSAIQSQNEILRSLAAKNPDIKVAAPNVQMPPRPTEFNVEIEQERGQPTRMRISAESPN